ncbi:MAG TPA: alpha/beta hydrolase [Mycobacteriales bacterium]|nr:alpha/beta hydrolase [Mycobacteriales bacterium]
MTLAPEIPGTTSRMVAVDGVRFHVRSARPARKRRTTPVLLLHGVPETSATWGALMADLGKDRVVLAPDLKGLGQSEAREPYDIPTLVAELAALVLHEVDGPVDVVGHDWGGSLGLALAGARPDLVRRLVVESGPYREIDPVRAWYMGVAALPVVPELAFRLTGDRIVRQAFATCWKADRAPELLDHYAAAYAPPERYTAMLGYYRAAVRPRLARAVRAMLSQEAPAIGLPKVTVERSLVVWGTDDPPTPLAVGEAVARDLGESATMLTVPGVGHFPHEEAPEVVLPAIAEFLRAP